MSQEVSKPLSVDNYKMRFLAEEPSDSDVFKGGAHELVAGRIWNTLVNQSELNNICLEGELGSGKSTVLKSVKAQLDNRFIVSEFDVEKYQCSSTKKALIHQLSDDLANVLTEEQRSELFDERDIAIGHKSKAVKRVDSQFNFPTLLLFISVIFSGFVTKPAIESIAQTLTAMGSNNSYFDPLALAYILIFMLPLLLPILHWLLRFLPCCSNWEPIKLGNFFKKNAEDTVTETIKIAKEAGAFELNRFFETFVKLIPAEKTLVLILDNLDRIPNQEKVREVWSDIELFTSGKHAKFKLILPFSAKQVASALSDDSTVGIEAIAKQCPTRYRIAPIVSADWQSAFTAWYKQAITIPKPDDELIKAMADVLEIWSIKRQEPITPRLLKQYINGIVSTLDCTPVPVSPLSAAVYYISVRRFQTNFNQLLADTDLTHREQEFPFEGGECRFNRQELKNDYKEVEHIQLIMSRYSERQEDWANDLLCIHFQTEADIALAEWLEKPLRKAIQEHNTEVVSGFEHSFGFEEAFRKLIKQSQPEDLVKLFSASNLNGKHKTDVDWNKRYLQDLEYFFNKRFRMSDGYNYDEALFKSINTLSNNKNYLFAINFECFADKFKSLEQKIIHGDDVKDLLVFIYDISWCTNVFPWFIEDFSKCSMELLEALWIQREKFGYWDIESKFFHSTNKLNVIHAVFSYPSEIDSSLVAEIQSRMCLGEFNFAVDGLENNDPIDSLFGLGAHVEHLILLDRAIFLKNWYRSKEYIPHYLKLLKQDDMSPDFIHAQMLTYIVQHELYIEPADDVKHALSIITSSSELDEAVSVYLVSVTKFSLLLKALANEQMYSLVIKPCKYLIEQDKIALIDINEVLIHHMDELFQLFTNRTEMIKWLACWESDIDWTLENKFNESFLKSVPFQKELYPSLVRHLELLEQTEIG